MLDSAREKGYRTYLYFICTESSLINIDRVAQRVGAGGHDVEPQRIQDRYLRALALLPRAVAASGRAYLFDNSGAGIPHRLFAEFESGKLKSVADTVPNWFVRAMPDVMDA